MREGRLAFKILKCLVACGVFLWCLCPLLYGESSPLDGAFASFGMDAGQGDIIESGGSVVTSTTGGQAYETKLDAYNAAITQLESNRDQTIATLQDLAQQLKALNPSSTALDSLIAQIDALAKNPDVKGLIASVNSSISAYQQYLNNEVAAYKQANQQIIAQQEAILKEDETKIDASKAQNVQTLNEAIKTFKALNNVITQVSHAIGVLYTPLSLPYPLNASGSNVSDLSASEVYKALVALSGDIDKMEGLFSKDNNTLSGDNQKIVEENANKLSELSAAKNAAITQAMEQITGVTQALGRAFHNQWVNYADGHTFFLTNGQNKYVDAGDTCVFNIVLNDSLSGLNTCGYQGWESGVPSGPNTIGSNSTTGVFNAFNSALKQDGFSSSQIWGTLFNMQELRANAFIGPSDCGNGGCSSAGVSGQEAQEGMEKFFSFMNAYVGNADFAGNFENSALYDTLEGDLEKGDTQPVSAFLNAYTHTFALDMLDFFVLNPVWMMSDIEPGTTTPPQYPTASNRAGLKNLGANVSYCYASPTVGLEFSEGYGVCQYNSWANAIFLGYFGFLTNQVPDVLHDVLETAYGPTGSPSTPPASNSAQASIAQVTTAYNNWKDFKPQKTFSSSIMPPIPNLTPTTPTGVIPISTSATSLPQINRPQASFLKFSTRSSRSHSLRLGAQAEVGYQKYFAPFFGMSYYGYFGYRYLYMRDYSTSDLADSNRYSLGFGVNLLSNFYSRITQNSIRAYGVFGGLLAVINVWDMQSLKAKAQVRTDANIDAVFGIQMRINSFKWSLGARMPLIQRTQTIDISNASGGHESLEIIDSYKTPQFFVNFAKVF